MRWADAGGRCSSGPRYRFHQGSPIAVFDNSSTLTRLASFAAIAARTETII